MRTSEGRYLASAKREEKERLAIKKRTITGMLLGFHKGIGRVVGETWAPPCSSDQRAGTGKCWPRNGPNAANHDDDVGLQISSKAAWGGTSTAAAADATTKNMKKPYDG